MRVDESAGSTVISVVATVASTAPVESKAVACQPLSDGIRSTYEFVGNTTRAPEPSTNAALVHPPLRATTRAGADGVGV